MNASSTGHYSRKTVDIKVVHSNLQQEVIQVTEDKLKLILNEHLANMEQRKSWVAPLGILITILLVFSTTTFKKAYFEASTWEAFFIMAGILTTAWLVRNIILAINVKSIDGIILMIKNKSESENN